MKKIILLILIFTVKFGNIASFAQSLQWAKRIGGNLSDKANSVAVDTLDNIYVAGQFQGRADFNMGGHQNPHPIQALGAIDAFVAKYKPDGDTVWARQIGGIGSMAIAHGIAVDHNGNAYVTGEFTGTVSFPNSPASPITSIGGSDIFLAKYDLTGLCLWAKNLGSLGNDAGYGVAIDASGNAGITGTIRGNATFGTTSLTIGTNQGDIFIAKYDSTGNTCYWAKNFGMVAVNKGAAIATDPLGNFAITGEFVDSAYFGTNTGPPIPPLMLHSAPGFANIFIAKYLGPTGNHMWAKPIGGSANDSANSIAIAPAGYVYVTGNFSQTANFDQTHSLISNGGEDIFAAKYAEDGSYKWAINIGNTNNEKSSCIAVTPDSSIFITGYYIGGNVDFDPSAAISPSLPASSPSDVNIFFAKYKDSVNVVHFGGVTGIGGMGYDEGNGITIDSRLKAIVVGGFSGITDFDPSPCLETIASGGAGSLDGFIGSYADHPPLSICMATVDSTSAHVTLFWPKPPLNLPNNIDSFRIYRQVDTLFTYVASVKCDSLTPSSYVDTVNPNQSSYVYKISVKFNDGSESPLSDSHETMHLTDTLINGHPLLTWNTYCGFGVVQYEVWRDTLNNGTFDLDTIVGPGTNTFTDYTTPNLNADYRIVSPNSGGGCADTTTRSHYSGSLSNIKHNSIAVGIKNNEFINMYISPNPTNGNVKINFDGGQNRNNGKLQVFNIYGESVYINKQLPANQTSFTIDLGNLASGIYFMEWSNDEKSVKKKLVLQK